MVMDLMQLFEKEIKDIEKKYLDNTSEITRDYKEETEIKKNYNGRQIFELLQNADDAAIDTGNGLVEILLEENVLTISNTGTPFNLDGLKSLLRPYDSGKSINGETIGKKGLGFRSILNWANNIEIKTKNFTIQYSKEIAKNKLEELNKKSNGKIFDEIQKKSKSLDTDYPISILACPKIINNGNENLKWATEIKFTCNNENLNEVVKQIKSLRFEELLFLNNISKIEIKLNDYHKIFEKGVIDDTRCLLEATDLINKTNSNVYEWIIFKENGELVDNNGKKKKYQLTIAYDEKQEYIDINNNFLYCFFKTDVKICFPALIHATFELNESRNHLIKNDEINNQLIEKLSSFMIESATKLTERLKNCSYNPLQLVIANEYLLDQTLKDYGLHTKLLEKIKNCTLFPTIANTYISLQDNPVFSDKDFASILNPQKFPKLLKYTKDELLKKFFKSINISKLKTDEDVFVENIDNDIDYYGEINKKCKLIKLLDPLYSYQKVPHLLVDTENKNILDDEDVYLKPLDDSIDLPQDTHIKYLNREMETYLIELFEIKERNNLVNYIKEYGVIDYSLSKIADSIFKQFDNPTKEECKSLLKWLWKHFAYTNIEFTSNINFNNIKVICRDKQIKLANQCYIGSEFDNELGERIISTYCKDNFIDYESIKDFSNDKEQIKSFLKWIGVSEYPRIYERDLNENEKNKYKDILSQRHKNVYSINEVESYYCEHLEEILTSVKLNVEDIFKWIINDCNVLKFLDQKSKVNASVFGNYKNTSNEINYIKLCFSQLEWISNKNGLKKSANYCCLEKSIKDIIITPNIPETFSNENKKQIEEFLLNIGVVKTFVDLPLDVIYEAFYKLKDIDENLSLGKSLYNDFKQQTRNQQYDRKVNDYIENNPKQYENFIKNGYVLSIKNGEKSYTPVSETFYLNDKGYSKKFLDQFNIIDIPYRSGEQKIHKLFGVKSLRELSINVHKLNETLHKCNTDFQKEYKNFIPFVYLIRTENDAVKENNIFSRLKNSNVYICENLSLEYILNGQTYPCILDNYETVYLPNNNTAYIVVKDEKIAFDDLKQDIEFAEAFSEIICEIVKLSENENSEFYRDLFRENDSNRLYKIENDKGFLRENLNTIRKKFGLSYTDRDIFWQIIAQLLNYPKENFNTESFLLEYNIDKNKENSLNYSDINDINNSKIIIEFFEQLSIDIEDFNKYAKIAINLIPYWKSVLEKTMNEIRDYYLHYIFTISKNSSEYIGYKHKFILNNVELINSINFSIKSSFYYNFNIDINTIKNQYDSNFILNEINKNASSYGIKDIEHYRKKYGTDKINDLILFGKNELDEFIKNNEELITKPDPPKITPDKINEPIIKPPSPPKIPTKLKNPKTNMGTKPSTSTHSNTYNPDVDKTKQEEGEIAEKHVYDWLKNNYDCVDWISSNAKKYLSQVDVNDGAGYDMSYIEQNEKYFVEIKSSNSGNISFNLTKNELNFALQNKTNYRIIFVKFSSKDYQKDYDLIELGFMFKDVDDKIITKLYENENFILKINDTKIEYKKDIE